MAGGLAGSGAGSVTGSGGGIPASLGTFSGGFLHRRDPLDITTATCTLTDFERAAHVPCTYPWHPLAVAAVTPEFPASGVTPAAAGRPDERGLVLVVEDERSIADLISLYLRREGFGVHVESHGDGALAALARLHPVAVVLDVGIPGPDGIEVCRRLRARDDWTPVIFVTARDDEVDRVLGLELGADDYVTKPFSPRELVARVRAVLRRTSGRSGREGTITVGRVRLDANQHRVWADEIEVPLTSTEFDLLEHLMRSPGRVFSREQLLSTVWGYEAAAGSRTVDVHVAQLRGKLGDASPIRTVRGVGYAADTAKTA